MALPLFDPIDIPPDVTLVDINSIADDDLRMQYQAQALSLWVQQENNGDWNVPEREWSEDEGMFLVEQNGTPIGIAIIFDVEGV